MAGTLTISQLSDGVNSTSSTNCIQGSARAWVRYNQVAQTITSSYNVSSITDNGTGDYTVNFTNAFPNANYTMAGSAQSDGDTPASIGMSNPQTSSCEVRLSQHNAGPANRTRACAVFLNT